jgi:TRAP-type mannitol/chloroaromatic compound transport system permease small subunit
MPSLNFVLPHWLYWGTLVVFPLVAWHFGARQRNAGVSRRPSLFVAYLFWVCSGFLGLHRFYLRSAWGLVFIPVFLAILHVNVEIRDAREDVSRTRAALDAAHSEMRRAQPDPGVAVSPERADRLARARSAEEAAEADFAAMQSELDSRRSTARWLALLLGAMLLVDAALLPAAVRRAAQREGERRAAPPAEPSIPDIPPAGTSEDPTLALHTRFTDAIEWVNLRAGEFVAYWAVVSVFAYYYEVIARFAFNSPTNWVHESMFLMYGMQYMLAGAYAYQADQHVRVDVFYTKFSARGKAIADLITSVFFFIFILTLLWTGGKFALDAIRNSEVSFTEWGVQYWPVKLMMPIGAALLALQGLAKLIKDIILLTRKPA